VDHQGQLEPEDDPRQVDEEDHSVPAPRAEAGSMKLIIYTDGGCRSNSATEPGPASCSFVVFDEQHNYVACMNETLIGSNNVAEYRGVLLLAL
jgi:hypothetical protein